MGSKTYQMRLYMFFEPNSHIPIHIHTLICESNGSSFLWPNTNTIFVNSIFYMFSTSLISKYDLRPEIYCFNTSNISIIDENTDILCFYTQFICRDVCRMQQPQPFTTTNPQDVLRSFFETNLFFARVAIWRQTRPAIYFFWQIYYFFVIFLDRESMYQIAKQFHPQVPPSRVRSRTRMTRSRASLTDYLNTLTNPRSMRFVILSTQ